jgi:hypothetical protein
MLTPWPQAAVAQTATECRISHRNRYYRNDADELAVSHIKNDRSPQLQNETPKRRVPRPPYFGRCALIFSFTMAGNAG